MSSVEPERKEQSRLLQEPAQDLLPWSICEWAGLVCACAMLNTWCIKAHDLSKFFGGTRKIRYRSNTRELCLPTGRLVSSEESLRTLGQRVPAVSATAWWFPNGREADELSQEPPGVLSHQRNANGSSCCQQNGATLPVPPFFILINKAKL